MKSFLDFLLRKQKLIFLVLTIICAVIIVYPTHNFQAPLAQGDHGKDLYVFQQTMEGKIPYQDYWWNYGPLMPYFYGLIFKIFGLGIQNILMAQAFLKVCAALFFYLALQKFFSPIFAFAGAAWFCNFQTPFNYTYNHSGGITILVLLAYALFSYINNPKISTRRFAFFITIILSFIKINFGLFSLLIVAITFPVIDALKPSKPVNKHSYFLEFFVSLLLILSIYWLFIKGLPLYALRQCFPFLPADRSYPDINIFSPIQLLAKITWTTIRASCFHLGLAAVFLFSSFRLIFQKPLNKEEKTLKKNVFLATGITFIFFVCMLHEFIPVGIPQRLPWAKPFQVLFVFLIIGLGMRELNKVIRWMFCIGLLIIVLSQSLHRIYAVDYIFKNPLHNFKINQTDIYITNPPDWFFTIHRTTEFLNNTLKENETFFALPYDALYYFLTNKESPTRQLNFFKHANISRKQEIKIIGELEKKNIQYVLLSSRCDSSYDPVLGTLGKTSCPLIATYIIENFEVIQTIGSWSGEPGWAWNHGTKILKRIK